MLALVSMLVLLVLFLFLADYLLVFQQQFQVQFMP
jgi:hypothetical protein